LRPYWPDLASLGGHAEKYAFDDPQSALIKLRCFAELMVGIVYREFRLPRQPTDKFVDRLQAAVFTAAVDKSILDKFHAIRKVGYSAAHDGKFAKGDSLWLLKEAPILSYWLLLSTQPRDQVVVQPFVSPAHQQEKPNPKKAEEHQVRLEQALAELEAAKAAEEAAVRENAKLKIQLTEAEQQKFEHASTLAKNSLELNEAETRRRMIDTELYSRGWD